MNQPNSPSTSDDYGTLVPAEVPPSAAADSSHALSNDGLSASLGFLVLFSSFILLVCSLRRWKTTPETSTFSQELKKWSDKLALDLPCRRCRYFQANRYLPCAVNPMQALTPGAVDCTDFEEKELG